MSIDVRVQIRIIRGRLRAAEGELSQALIEARKLVALNPNPSREKEYLDLQDWVEDKLSEIGLMFKTLDEALDQNMDDTINSHKIGPDGSAV